MPDIEFFAVCSDVIVDAATNEISLLRITEDVFANQFPIIIPKAVAVSSWHVRADEQGLDFQIELFVTRPGQENRESFRVNAEREGIRFRAIQGLLAIPIDQSGDLVFEVCINGVHGATHTVRIHNQDAVRAEGRVMANN